MGGTPGAPPLGHCPRDVINLKNAPTLGHSQAPPPLDIARVTSSTYSKGGTKLLKGGTKLLKGGTKLLKGGTKLLKGGTKLLKGGTKLLKGGTKLLKGGTKSLGWATGGGSYDPPPWLRACTFSDKKGENKAQIAGKHLYLSKFSWGGNQAPLAVPEDSLHFSTIWG